MAAAEKILIFSSLGEPCTNWVIRELDQLGAEHLLINFEEAVLSNLWSIKLCGDSESALSIRQGSNAGSNEIAFRPKSVWMRRWGHPIYPSSFNELSTAFAFNEISALISALPSVLRKTLWINDLSSERVASNKVYQLDVAKALGFRVPRTLVTNDHTEVRAFVSAVGRTIFKPASGFQPQIQRFNAIAHAKLGSNGNGMSLDFGKKLENDLIFTQELTKEKMDFLASLRWSPAIFQERIEKKFDIRVTVVGDEMFTCRIDSQSRVETKTDFRMMNLAGIVAHELVSLNTKLQEMIYKLMRKFNLVFGCLDFIESATGEFYFLEVNPAGQWLWIEQLTGAKISRSIARQLTAN